MKSQFQLIIRAILIPAMGMALFMSGCAPKPVTRYPEVREEVSPHLFDRAEQAFLAGNDDLAREDYARYLEVNPRGEKSRTALYRISSIDLRNNRPEEALGILKRIVEEYPEHPDTHKVQFDIIDTYYRLGDYQQSQIEASQWFEKYPFNPLRGDVFFLMGRNFRAMENFSKAFYWWLQAYRGPFELSVTRDEIDERILGLIKTSPAHSLKEMAPYATGTKYAPEIYHQLAYTSLEMGNLEEAKYAAMALIRSTPEQYWVSIGRRILERVTAALSVKVGSIGCILPLSGPFAIYGQEVLNGIQLGMGLFGQPEGERSIDLIIQDSRGEAEVAVSLVEEMAEKNKVMAIIGPLASKPSVAAAKRAQELGIPIITLTQKEGITFEGDMVFRNFMTPSKEIRRILDKAIKDMSLKTFGILYPDNSYGRFFMNLFWDQAAELGGSVTAIESYQPDKTDFADEIKKMIGLHYPRPKSVQVKVDELKWLEAEERIKEGSNSKKVLDPIVDFDAIFIPDNYHQVALITPQFPFYSVFDVRFLGTSLWQSPELIEMAGDYIQGAIFPAGFFMGDGSELSQDFIKNYIENFEKEPGILAATGYDTIRLLKALMQKGPISTRKEFQTALIAQDDFYGVTGWLSFDRDGEVLKDPLLLTVSGSRLVVLP
jgi:ABC-type branched-subunit amino acid transport system substrate-binding protein/outer membrane protein assembly factor BamD (BamD/ComL family)